MYVPAGSTVTYQFKAPTSLSNPSGTDIEQAVANDLNAATFHVQDYNVDDSFSDIIASAGVGYTVQVTMKVRTGNTDYASESDVQSIFDHYVFQETGVMPASVILGVAPPGGQTQSTGQGQTPPGGGGGGGNQPSSIWDSITKFFEGFGTGAILTVGVVIVGGILLLGYLQSRKLI